MQHVLFHEHPDVTPQYYLRESAEGASVLAMSMLQDAPVHASVYVIPHGRFFRKSRMGHVITGKISKRFASGDPDGKKVADPAATGTAA